MRIVLVILIFWEFISCSAQPTDKTKYFPKQIEIVNETKDKQNVWVFMLAGQSNMAGRGFVEPEDTMPVKRLLTINESGQLIIAKEPLHFYEPSLASLDCGYSFGTTLIKSIPDSISVLLIPAAV